MRAPRITAENLTNQVDVVSEEIRLNVLNRPYGGFPWIQLPAMLFDSFANAHNGYGDFVDLQAATVADCAEFFETYYTPANAVLTVCGDFDVDDGRPSSSTQHFGDIPFRPAPVRPSFDEPWPTIGAGGRAHRPARPVAGAGGRLAAARPGRRPARLPGVRRAGRHADRRRILPAAVSALVAKAGPGDGHLGEPGAARRPAGLPRPRRLRARRDPPVGRPGRPR